MHIEYCYICNKCKNINMGFTVKWQKRGVIVVFDGILKADDIIKANNNLYGDKRFDTMEYQIFDYRFVDGHDIDESDIGVIGILDKSASKWNRNIKSCNITSDEFGIQMIEKYAEIMNETGWETRIFTNLEDALEWCEKEIDK